ncbi:MAG: hypothetical protein ACOC3Z_00955 [Nanoarchaeota archaeon]
MIDIPVEISGNCNLRCPNCNTARRLHIPYSEKRIDLKLDEKIIKYVPKNSRLLFVGIGEPLLTDSQKRIKNILDKRDDVTGFVQTNGTQKLIPELIQYVKENRLEIGTSYDEHHEMGGRTQINIQTEFVEALSLTVEKFSQYEKLDFEKLKKTFPNLKRILIDPYLDKDNVSIISEFKEVEKTILHFKKNLKNTKIKVYTFLNTCFFDYPQNLKYCKDLLKETIEINKHFRYSKKDYLIAVEDFKQGNNIRILTNGEILTDLNSTFKSWNELDKEKLTHNIQNYNFNLIK